jgi:hypothetical protein
LSKEEAKQRTNALIGVSDPHLQSTLSIAGPESVAFEDSTTPFLGKYAKGRTAWKVIVGTPISATKDSAAVQNVVPMEVYLDSIDGHLLKVECDLEDLNPKEDIIPKAQYAERQMRGSQEEYLGFPVDLPAVDFVTAIKACRYNPFVARKIVGQYVILSKDNREHRPVWVITLWGIPPIEPIGGEADWVPIYQRNHIRQVVDAVTGKLLYASTHPNAPLTPEIKSRVFGVDSTDN